MGGLFAHDQLLESKSSQRLLCLFQHSPLRVKKSVHWCDSNPKVIKKDTNFTRKSVFLLIFDQHRISQSKSASWKKFLNFDHRATCKKLEKSYGPVLRSVKISAFPSVHFELLCAPGALPWNAQNLGRLNVGPPREIGAPTGKFGNILIERVARATLTNVDSFIDWLIDAPGLRPARDCRYGDIMIFS